MGASGGPMQVAGAPILCYIMLHCMALQCIILYDQCITLYIIRWYCYIIYYCIMLNCILAHVNPV